MINREQAGERDFSILYLRRGVPEAFKILFFEYYPELFSFSLLLLQSRPVAQKMTMEAFFLLWQRRTEFDSAKNIKAFLYLAVRNKGMQQLKESVPSSPATGSATVDAIPSSLPPELLRELFAFAARS